MKVVLSNKAYLNPDEEIKKRLETNLTYMVEESHSRKKIPRMVLHYGLVSSKTYWMPTQRLDLLQGYELEIVDKRSKPETYFGTTYNIQLRPDQQEIYDQVTGSCIINGKPGFGKTVLAIAIAVKLGLKTLVVCTTTVIRDMWVQEIDRFLGIKAGVIGSGRFELDAPIVVGNIQTLSKHGLALADKFGTVIVDEMHHCPASTFSKLLMESKALHKIGLSGTLVRRDGMHTLFKDFFGFEVYSPAVANTIPPKIHLYDLEVEMSGNQLIPWADKVTAVIENPLYKQTMLALANSYVALGHKVLFISDRTATLKYIHENVQGRSVLYTGELDLEDREKAARDMSDGKLDIFCAMQSIFSEGVSQNELSCLILSSFIGDNESLIEQLAGRVMRKHEGKLEPVIVDIRVKGHLGYKHRRDRMKTYIKNNWEAEVMSLPKLVASNENKFAKLLSFKV
ncbi:DNA helicase [Vibrio phage JSF12]|uniref:DNA helicase n=3 Tax=Jesfedecavirus TaxID=2560156 RepID=A0A2D0YLV1_9CAUD|nr:putative ATP-dependent helicase [Vibrio phage phi 3]YP_009618476.1 DNA helicase [Vibrio phage JSF10]YP_009794815.1 DNA helicase [Vibrio phage JSF12]AJF40881.1 putative ATP-dependent helicase [Vibrio phage phi 3]ASV43449.1 DNA helicase [Vibrio phage JSF10]ASV43650.1 DNA helicase [Vibrio phage JSF12]